MAAEHSAAGLFAEPLTRKVQLPAGWVEITPLPVGRYAAFARAGGERALGLFVNLPQTAEDWLALLRDDGEALLATAAIGADLPRSDIDALPPDALIPLLLAIVEVNLDFFHQRLAPALVGAGLWLAVIRSRIASTTSRRPAPGSSAAATVSTRSAA